FPFSTPLGAPAAGTPRRVTGKTGRLLQRFEFLRQRGTFTRFEGGSETDVIKQAFVVVKSEEQRPDDACAGSVTETANHAIGSANLFDLHHCGPFARGIRN